MIFAHNPLLQSIAATLEECRGESISEYQLLGQLVEKQVLDADYAKQSLSLFQAHFLTMNALYQLRQRYWQGQTLELSVSPLAIELREFRQSGDGSSHPSTECGEVASYYLDWSNFTSASEASVQELLDSFWKAYVQPEDTQQALQTLGLQEPVSWATIKQAYRRLAMHHHPDRDGDAQTFSAIQQAYGTLRSHYPRNPDRA